MPRELVEGRAVTMLPSDWAVVEAADVGDAGVSATLRKIVREWRKLTTRTPTLSEQRPAYRLGFRIGERVHISSSERTDDLGLTGRYGHVEYVYGNGNYDVRVDGIGEGPYCLHTNELEHAAPAAQEEQ